MAWSHTNSSLLVILTFLLLVCCYGTMCSGSVCESTQVCAITLSINSSVQPGSTCVPANTSGNWVCGDIQSSLESLLNLSFPASIDSQVEEECVSILIPAGETHYITAPLFLGGVSVHFVGVSESGDICNSAGINGTMLPLPSITCNYTVEVNSNRTFDLDYDYTDYLLYFNQSAAVSFQNVQMISCPYPIRLNAVDQVSVRNSLFREFSEAVFDMFNCHNISITSSTFHDNRGTGISRYRFRGNTGAVAIGFDGLPLHYTQPQVFISDCNFTRNRATAESRFRSSSGAFFNRAFAGRGGGVGVFFNNDYHNVTVRIVDNVFEGNYARSFGGAVFLVIFNEGSHHSLNLERNIFNSNTGVLGGGSVQMTFISNGIPDDPHITRFVDCVFRDNSGASGGAIFVYPAAFQGGDGNQVIFERCEFIRNRGLSEEGVEFGAAIGISFSNFFRSRESYPKYRFTDCTFEGNSGSNGVVSIAYASVQFFGNNTFRDNTQTSALRIVGSLVELHGDLSFVNNSVEDVAALHLLSLGQIRITSGLTMEFSGNRGRYGASILVETPSSIQPFQMLAFNPQCFVLNQTPNLPPSSWTDVSIKFRKNEAVLASSIYMSHVDSCSWFSPKPPFFNTSSIKGWPIWEFDNESRNTGFNDLYSSDYHVETSAVAINSPNDSVTHWPGHNFDISLTGWDQFNHPTFISARFFAESTFLPATNLVSINPPLVITDTNKELGGTLINRYTLSYSVSDVQSLLSNHTPVANVSIDVPFTNVHVVSTDHFVIYPMPCPVGYSIGSGSTPNGVECRCREDVQEILTCEDDQDTILLQSGYWGAPYSDDPSRYSEEIDNFYPCPAGYCRCSQETSLGPTLCVYTYKISEPDAQCAPNRQGVLCGECQSDRGLSALLSNCVTCNNAFSLLIIVLILLDVIVFVLLTLWDKPLPGLFFPFIFYLQIAPYVGQYFPNSFEVVGKYLVFVGSALSFYFPYDFCLYENMSSLVAYFLRYIPIIIAMVMCPLLIIVRRRRMRVLDHFGPWWIALLLYTPVVHTSITILHCPYIETLGEFRWFVDGSVRCFTGWHAPLGLFALLMLLLCFGLIPLVVIITLHMYPRKWFYWLRTISLPPKENYREEVKWWFAVELGRRLVFLLLFIPLPIANVAPILIICILVAVYGLVQPYKSQWANMLEIIVLCNFLFLLMLQSTQLIKDTFFVFPAFTNNQTNATENYSGVATLTWLLLPFYYLPLLVLLIVGATFIIYQIKRKKQRQKKKIKLTAIEQPNNAYIAPNVRTVSVRISKDRAVQGVASTRSHYLLRERHSSYVQKDFKEPASPAFSTSSTVFNNEAVTDS